MKLSPAQFKALESAIKYGNATRHLSGQSAWGGWGSTRMALQRMGLLNDLSDITEAGREVMRQFNVVSETPRVLAKDNT